MPAGSLIAGRYRIVGLLGRGGMGEVYRADDLELGTSVALKLLPVECAGDPVRLEHLCREVRLARQVSHPNVCRVHDIGSDDGGRFLSMEYIDGEDLASLLRRIGRLTGDKAVALAAEICAGLAAAHDHDVLHCDLKPANVMIDGRGRARLTDFGIASALHDPREAARGAAGTPAYMAPEVLAGGRPSRASDLYSLGLVLYELFTGRRAHDATSIAGLRELHASGTPFRRPSDLVEDIDPVVERAILRCLEPAPENRPPSAIAVLASLPGRDPLRALVEAGETPSPELVAASGQRGVLSRRQAGLLVAVWALGLGINLAFIRGNQLDDLLGGVHSPAVLEHRAREILAAAGSSGAVRDSAWGFDVDPAVLARLAVLPQARRRESLRSSEQPVLRFWYRESPAPMANWRSPLPGSLLGDTVTPEDPPLVEPGMSLVRLGPRGGLIELRRVPEALPATRVGSALDAAALDPLLAAAGLLTGEGMAPASMADDGHWRWSVPWAGDRRRTTEVEAVLVGGSPIRFRVVSASVGDEPSTTASGSRVATTLDLTNLALLLGGAGFAWRNARSQRWDRRGALRLATVTFVLCAASVMVAAHHTAELSVETRIGLSAISYGATRALLVWLLYVAIEPTIRRHLPTALVSWTRLLSGRPGDPAIGRDLLLGVAAASSWFGLGCLCFWLSGDRGSALPLHPLVIGDALRVGSRLSNLLRSPVLAVSLSLGFLLALVLLQDVLRRPRWVAPAGLWALTTLVLYGSTDLDWGAGTIVSLALAAIGGGILTLLAVRAGLLAFVTTFTFAHIGLLTVVPTTDPSDWYFGSGAVMLALMLATIVFGFRTATIRSPRPREPVPV